MENLDIDFKGSDKPYKCASCGAAAHTLRSNCGLYNNPHLDDEIGEPTIESELSGKELKEWREVRAERARKRWD